MTRQTCKSLVKPYILGSEEIINVMNHSNLCGQELAQYSNVNLICPKCLLIYGIQPDPEQIALAAGFVTKDGSDRKARWTKFVQTLFVSNQFLFRD